MENPPLIEFDQLEPSPEYNILLGVLPLPTATHNGSSKEYFGSLSLDLYINSFVVVLYATGFVIDESSKRTGFTKKPAVAAFSVVVDAFRIMEFAAWFDVPAFCPIAIAFMP